METKQATTAETLGAFRKQLLEQGFGINEVHDLVVVATRHLLQGDETLWVKA